MNSTTDQRAVTRIIVLLPAVLSVIMVLVLRFTEYGEGMARWVHLALPLALYCVTVAFLLRVQRAK